MTGWRKSWLVLLLSGLLSSLLIVQPAQAIPSRQQTVFNSTLIYYRDDQKDECGDSSPISLGDFIKKTLPNEWIESWGNTPGGDEALKAGAITIRSWILSADNAEIYTVGGQSFFCVRAWSPRIEFDLETDISAFPHSAAAVDDTDGIIMTHPDAPALLGVRAINAQFRTETGIQTLAGNQDWLVSIYDPISEGHAPSPTPTGMGVWGSKRWAWGLNEAGERFPKWDFRRILVHYYTGIEFAGPISPCPTGTASGQYAPTTSYVLRST